MPEYVMPAEWERHEATWFTWPHNASDWPGKFEAIPWVFADVIRKVTATERLKLIVRDEAERESVLALLKKASIPSDKIGFYLAPTDRNWLRDNGPIFAREASSGMLAMIRFRFNGWGLYPEWQLDDAIPGFLGEQLQAFPLIDALHDGKPVVLEGGSIDVNGNGTLLTTEECLLSQEVQVRNPGMTREQLEAVLRQYLGATNVIWLGDGHEGDETHGHVDDITRFVNERTIVSVREADPTDANHRALEDNWQRLQDARLEDGSKPEVVALPMPGPIFLDGFRLPASYANFYIINDRVLVPTFNDPNDVRALGILGELFPDREVIGIHSLDLIAGGGTLHCSTQQLPA